jgi:very-short-patch-repair endonuclease
VSWTDQAQRQDGAISRSQLATAGLSLGAINGIVRRGGLVLTRVAGVYRVAGAPDGTDTIRWTAALGTKSPLSYLTAAQVWELPAPDDGMLHITRFDRRRLDWPPGVRVHRVALEPIAVTHRGGLLVTTRTETLLDCLGWMQLNDARTLADRAQQQRWLTPADIKCRLENQPRRWGNKRLRLLLPTIDDGAHSQAERCLHKVLRSVSIGGWQPNFAVRLDGKRYVVDLAFVEQRIAIEIDGYGPHSQRGAFQNDRTKGNALIKAGWTLLRFTWSDLHDRPDYVIATIRALLAD